MHRIHLNSRILKIVGRIAGQAFRKINREADRQIKRCCKDGFSLVELLVAMAIGSIVMAAIFAVFQTQVRGQITQEVTLEMQQGARAALEIMGKEIRSAACDPTASAGAAILIAERARLRFTMDIVDFAGNAPHDGMVTGPGENITYALTNDANRDGIADGTPCHLGRDTGDGNGLRAVCENVDALNFVYRDADDNILAAPVADPNRIQRIDVTFVARSGEVLRGLMIRHVDNRVYENMEEEEILPVQNDNFRRLQQNATFYIRNN